MSTPYDVFVSYSRHDQDRVRPWVARLREGGLEVFFDTESLVGGSEWREAIVDAINAAKMVIFVASEHAFSSGYVPKELSLAEDAKKFILPIFLDKTGPSKKAAFILADLHRINANGKSDDEIWPDIVRALKAGGVEWKEPEVAEPVHADDATETSRSTQRRRKRDDAWLEWDVTDSPSGPDAQNAQTQSGNERRHPIELKVEEGNAEDLVLPVPLPGGETVEELDGPEVAGRCIVDSIRPVPGGDRIEAVEIPEESVTSEAAQGPEFKAHASNPDRAPDSRRRALLYSGGGIGVLAVCVMILTGKKQLPTDSSLVVPQVVKAVPVRMSKTLNETASDLMTEYYAASAKGDPSAQTALMSDPLADYFDTKPCPIEEVRADISTYAATWPRQRFDILGPIRTVENAEGQLECEAEVSFTTENEIVSQSGTFHGRVTVDVLDGVPKIVAVNQVPGTRNSLTQVFKRDAQEKRVIEFVRKAVLTGNSSPPTSAEDIAALFVARPSYYGKIVTHEEIVAQVHIEERFKSRVFEIIGGPTVVDGIETNHVTVLVKINFKASRSGEPKPTSRGTVTASYVIQFSAAGTPLISSVEEVERLPEMTR
jgi:hypothetical protein